METLHKDLARYAYNGLVHHPLVIGSSTADAANINRTYRYKKDALSKARADGDWEKYVFLRERPYHLDAMFKAPMKHLRKNPSEFWKLVGRVWRGTEFPYRHPKKWRQLWGGRLKAGGRACRRKKYVSLTLCLNK